MGDMVIFNNDKAEVFTDEGVEEIVIYCDLCNEPVAISPVANDEVLLKCIRCHAVSSIVKPVNEPTQEI